MSKIVAASEEKKAKYRVKNWSAYNKSLCQRGNLTLYLSEDACKGWYADPEPCHGAEVIYSNACMEVCLLVKTFFKLPYRQTQGFLQSILALMGEDDLQVPSYTQMSRRAKKLDIEPYLAQPGKVIAFDSTGLKISGEGEWKVKKHGSEGRRQWKKLHIGCDPATGYIHCHVLTGNEEDDGSQLEPMLEQVDTSGVEESLGDGGYDHEKCWSACIDRGIFPVIPPRSNAVEWEEDHPRTQAVRFMHEHGIKEWKKQSGYHRRSLAETQMQRIKGSFGGSLYSKRDDTQRTETAVKIKLINIFTGCGMPISERVV